MNQRMGWLAVGLGLAVGVVACSGNVQITAESTSGSASSAHGSSSGHPGGTGGAGSGSGSSGTGAAGPGSGKVVTADNDIGQYASFAIMPLGNNVPGVEQKVVDGPFFVTDVYGATSFYVVTGGDCAVVSDKLARVLDTTGGGAGQGSYVGQAHGIRLPILPGQTLCVVNNNINTTSPYTVLGFRPY